MPLNPARLRTAFFKNATVNVIRLAAFSIVALCLPPLLVHRLSKETYAVWVLIMQLSAYVLFFDFGLQSAVSHFVTYTEEKQDFAERDRIVSSATWLLTGLAGIGCLLVAGLTWQLPHFFHDIPRSLQPVARLSLLLVGTSVALGLPVSVLAAIFLGRQQNQVPAGIAIVGRVLAALLIASVVLAHRGLVWMAAVLAVSNIASYWMQYAAWSRWASDVHIARGIVSGAAMRRLAQYCWGIIVWTAGGLLISGLDTTIVGVVDFGSLGYYGVAATLTLFLIQFQGAVMSALLPVASMLWARDDRERLGELLVRCTRYGLLLLLLVGLPMILAAEPVLRLWVGADYAAHTARILQVLVAGNVVRLIGLPYATLVVGTNQQHLVTRSPIIEGIVNLLVSIWAGWMLGAIGVAIGTLVGAFFSIGIHLLYSMPRTTGVPVDRPRFLREGVLQPLICALPVLLLALVLEVAPAIDGAPRALMIGAAGIATMLLLWSAGLAAAERQRILVWVQS